MFIKCLFVLKSTNTTKSSSSVVSNSLVRELTFKVKDWDGGF